MVGVTGCLFPGCDGRTDWPEWDHAYCPDCKDVFRGSHS